MKRLLAIGVALAMILAAAPAGAKPPKKPPKGLVEVEISANLWALNLAGDTIEYTISVTNKTGDDLTGVRVTSEVLGSDPEPFVLLDTGLIVLPTDGEVYVATHDVDPLPPEELVNTVTVTVGGVVKTASVATSVWDLGTNNLCSWDGAGFLETIQTEYKPCLWVSEPGSWDLTIVSTTSGKKPANVQVTVRDHVPGNWCGAFGGRVKGGESVIVDVLFPASGICEQGGAGGATMGVGTVGAYYLVAMGDITVQRTAG
jgi:hypothetical protein